MWKRVVGYGALLAAGTLALQWLDYQRLARMHSGDVYLFLVAAAFLVLGIVLGVRVFAAPAPTAFDGNPKAQAELCDHCERATGTEEVKSNGLCAFT